ncbi:26S proteasome non-ATPase regulatory subunit 7 [Balamuthia mandrillaris]
MSSDKASTGTSASVLGVASHLPQSVVVHPLVLLSVVDHYNRVAKDTKKRVVGVLLGETNKGVVDITNSYAVPFEEDARNPSIWFLDHDYHENMFAMFRKVNAKEHVVGWYSTGPKIRPADLEINELWRRYTPNPVLVIINVVPTELGLPTKAYVTQEEVSEDGKESKMTFKHIPSEIGAVEAEEVGVEHLLRDIHDSSISTVATNVNAKLLSLRSLLVHLKEMHQYLSNVCEGKLPINHNIINQLQDIFNLLPNLNVEEAVKAFAVKTNDMMLVIYLSSLIRSIIAMHNLINNKLDLKAAERKALEEKDKKEKEKEKKEGEEGEKDGEKKKEGEEKSATTNNASKKSSK